MKTLKPATISWLIYALILSISVIFIFALKEDPGHRQVDYLSAYAWVWVFFVQFPLGSILSLSVFGLIGKTLADELSPSLLAAFRTLPMLGLLLVPLALFATRLLPEFEGSHALNKQKYFGTLFFALRSFVYFGFWLITARYLRKLFGSARVSLDAPGVRPRLAWILIFHVLISSLAAIDWIMALQEKWHSNAVGFMFLASQFATAMAFAILHRQWLAYRLKKPWRSRYSSHVLLTALIFWVYISFCNYLISWYGNLPDKVIFYLDRTHGSWEWFAWPLFAFHALAAALFFIPASIRQRSRFLISLAGLVLVFRIADAIWMIVPSFGHPSFHLSLWDLGIFTLISLIFASLVAPINSYKERSMP